MMGVDNELKLPKGFEFKCNTKKSIFDYPPILKGDDKKEKKTEKKKQLSTTLRVQARDKKKNVNSHSKMELESESKPIAANEEKA